MSTASALIAARPAAAAPTAAYRATIDTITHARKDGHLADGTEPAGLLALILSLGTRWLAASTGPSELASAVPLAPERLAACRAILLVAVEALLTVSF